MRNFLALLGWSPGGDREIVAEDEMIRLFTLEGIQKKAAVFDPAKLEWMNGQYLSALPAEELLEPVRRRLAQLGLSDEGRDLRPIIESVKSRARTILELAERVAVRLEPSRSKLDVKGEALMKKMGPAFDANLRLVIQALAALPPERWHAEPILDALKALAEARGLKLGDVMQPVRVALTGSTVSEPVNELLAVVGRERSLARVQELAPPRSEPGAA
jgi:glutamyl-tRNA synthetase